MYLNLYLMVLTVVENVLKYFKRERGGAGGEDVTGTKDTIIRT